MKTPTFRAPSAMAAAAASNISITNNAVDSGDLLLVIAGVKVSSNFTFPAGFTRDTVVTSVGQSAIGWKWAALADSGSAVVCSVNAAPNLLWGVTVAVYDVASTATPLKNLITLAQSLNYNLTGSMQGIGLAQQVCVMVGLDNVAVTQTGLTNSGWTLVESATTTTGSDAQMNIWRRPLTLANSGVQFNPCSGAGTRPSHAYTFQLVGVPEVVSSVNDDGFALIDGTISAIPLRFRSQTDSLSPADTANIIHARKVTDGSGLLAITDSGKRELTWDVSAAPDGVTVSDGLTSVRRLVRILSESGLLAVLDSGEVRRILRVVAEDELDLLDNFTKDVVTGGGGGGTVYTLTKDSTSFLMDEALRVAYRVRSLGDNISAADERLFTRTLSRAVSDAALIADNLFRVAIRQAFSSEGLTLTDALIRQLMLTRLGTDPITLIDAISRQGSQSKTLSDGAVLTDGALRAATFTRTSLETITLLDELRASRVHGRLVADLLSVDDKRNLLLVLNRGESLSVADGTMTARILQRALTDALLLDDLQFIKNVTIGSSNIITRVAEEVNAITISDGVQKVRLLRRISGDSITIEDFRIVGGSSTRTLTDTSLAITDGTVRSVIRNRQMQDLIAAIFDQAVKGVDRWRLLQDATSPADFSLKMLARTVLLADSITMADGTLTGRISVRRLADALEATDGFIKIFLDALAGLLDVRIVISALQLLVELGQCPITFIGADAPPVLGGYN